MVSRYFGEYLADPTVGVRDFLSRKATEVQEDPVSFARGLSYQPLQLIGGPVDIMNLIASPINEAITGRPIVDPVMGGNWLIDQYAKIRPSMARTGSPAEETGRFLSDIIDPIVVVKVGKMMLKGMESLDVFSDLKRWSETGETPRWTVERDDEAGILKVRGVSARADDQGAGGGSTSAVSGERQIVEGASGTNLTDAEVKQILADEKLNIAYRLADDYTQANFGVPYNRVDPASVESSIVKQAAIGRVYELAVTGDDEYKALVFDAYKREMPDVVAQSGAENYDDLVQASYEAMARETKDQFREMMPSDMTFTFHQGELEYDKASDAFRDITENRNLNVFRGGDEHEYLKNVDPETGLTENEMFRAVHDMFGHAAGGNSFQPKGEEIAFMSHSQMYSPLARLAMASETRGQNSWLNYGTANAPLFKELRAIDNEVKDIRSQARRMGREPDQAKIDELQSQKKKAYEDLQYAEQRSVLLPPEYISPDFNDPYFVPPYLRELNMSEREAQPFYGLHIGPEGLSVVDPAYQGTSRARGEEMGRINREDAPAPQRQMFYGPDDLGAIQPESFIGQPYRATGQGLNLYNFDEDPLGLLTLAGARYPNTDINRNDAALNTFESLLPVYGYQGYVARQKGGGPVTTVFDPVRVTPSTLERRYPSPRNDAERAARDVLQMLDQGREAEITDEMFLLADKSYLDKYYSLPLDTESRMQRAREMGFDPEDVRYTGTDVPFEVIDRTLWSSNNPYIAGMYGENVFPLLVRDDDKITVNAGGANWNDIQGSSMITLPSNEPTILDVAMPKTGTSYEGGPYNTNDIEYMASRLRVPTADILDVIDFGMNFRPLTESEAAIRRTPSTTRIDLAGSGSNVRSPTARFDPRLSHLANIGASIAAPVVTAQMIEELLRDDTNAGTIY